MVLSISVFNSNTIYEFIYMLNKLFYLVFHRMCLLARMIDSVSTLHGGALTSKICAYSRHGDSSIHGLAKRIMHRICNPFYRYTASDGR